MNFFIFLAIIGEFVKTDGLKSWCDQMEQLCFFTFGMKKYVSNINEAHELCVKEDAASKELDMYNKYILYSVIRYLETTEFNKKVSSPPFYFIVKSWHDNRQPCSRPAVNYDVYDTTFFCPDSSITKFNVVCMMSM
ncbi:hypothetical protein HELRODRAFT_168596 [Helobdella robusta]|uniref:C-type lectin domain-containing protein n=1 Tax=Helobdella robusta TaxID=6412 RepID=T1F0S0_HELRO|nr:hypothetical protein HELRODRAFT_168596 [Helobdella robusta]ESO09587.1 hypothetical protein HELRODRAFT_168596 [Helobdella robusta]